MEQRVGGQRTADIDAVGFEPRDGGRNDRAVLFAERTFFAGVGIEPGYGEPRPWNAEPAGQIARYDAPGLDHKLGRQMCEDFAQRQMDRHRHDRQLGRPQHHDRPLPLAGRLLRQRRQKFGLPRLGETPAVEDILRHRTGNHGGGGAGEDVGDRAAQRRDGGGRARPIGTTRLGTHRNIEADHRQSGRKRRGSRRRRHRGDRDFKAEPLGAPADKIRIGD